MSEHLFDGVSHDEGRGHYPLLTGEVHGVELTGSVSAEGASGRGTVGMAAPAGRLSPIVRATSHAYTVAAVVAAVFAFVLAPWGLLLLIVTLAALAVAVLLQSMAAGLAAFEEDES
ncbi:hypothetical protein [Microbacterium sp. K36]|uniref:hypothetical protein n=1 Tax=Microbacterium sp. K36 TaxID=2305439 RepID=UPI00109C763A|nr:hypothetical protein [Microbacterium sp. K36]